MEEATFQHMVKGKENHFTKREKKDKRVTVKRSYGSFWQGSLPELI